MTIQEEYTYALETLTMLQEHLERETPSIYLTQLKEQINEIQKEVEQLWTIKSL